MPREVSIRQLSEFRNGRRAVCWTRLLVLKNCKEKKTHINKSRSPNDASHLLRLKIQKMPIAMEQSTKKIIIKVNLRMELKTPFEWIYRVWTMKLNRWFRCPCRCSMRYNLWEAEERNSDNMQTDVTHKLQSDLKVHRRVATNNFFVWQTEKFHLATPSIVQLFTRPSSDDPTPKSHQKSHQLPLVVASNYGNVNFSVFLCQKYFISIVKTMQSMQMFHSFGAQLWAIKRNN